MGRMLKLTNTKKLATHNNMLQIVIIACLSWEMEKNRQDQRKLVLRSYTLSGASGKVLPSPRRSPVVTAGLSDSWESSSQVHSEQVEPFL